MLHKLLWNASQANPQKTAIVYGSLRIDYQTLYQLVGNLSSQLINQGVGAADCVGVVLPNCPEFVISLFACARLSAIMLPLDPAFQASELKRYFDDSQPKVIVTDTLRAAACREAIQDTATILQVDNDGLVRIERRVEDGEEINGEVDTIYLYTSGSTGEYKRVCRTQKNLFCEGQNFVKTLGLTPDDNILGIVPFYHSYGLENALFAAISANSTLVILEPLIQNGVPVETPFVARQQRVLELIQQEKIRVLPAVPYQYAALAQLPLDVEADLSGVSWCISSGNFLPEETYQQFGDRFGQPIRSLYGSTEAGSISMNRAPAEQMEYGTLGPPFENVTIKILDDDDQELPANQTGHVLVKSPVLAPVIYSNLPELSQQVVWNGYYRTSDLGYMDGQGRLSLTGRKKVFIDTGGYKVDPGEIKQVLLAHSKVEEAVVLGVKAANIGQIIKAVIVSKETLQESDIRAYCRERLARFKVPRIIEFRDQLPRSPLGKILKKELLNVPTYMAQEELLPATSRSFYLHSDTQGILDNLQWCETERIPPKHNEIEIEVYAVGLNFVDVLSALHMVPSDMAEEYHSAACLGSECAGRVVAVGEAVEEFQVDQEVIAIAMGSFSSHVTIPASLAVPKPANLTFCESVTLPINFLTAYYSLQQMARLTEGERVLIHAASGGVGLAAIQIAQHIGAEIYATAGNEQKRAYLRQLGIRHVMNSRSLDFADEIRQKTNGEGVDVVLNSLGGEFIDTSFSLLRDFGRFVELGKRDYIANRPLGLQPFLKGLSFTLVNLHLVVGKQIPVIHSLLETMISFLEKGVIKPLRHRIFQAKDVVEAFRYMAEAKHIGKVVLSLQDDTLLIAPSASINQLQSLKKRLYQDMKEKSLNEQKGILTGYIQQVIVDTLQSDNAVFSPDQSFRSMGFDSLFAAEFQNRLSNLIGISLPIMTIWNYPTINQLAVALLNKIRHRTVSSEFLDTSIEKLDRELSGELSMADTEKHHGAPSTSVVPLQPRGNSAPFYCLPGAGGGVLYMHGFGQAMADQHPVYGLESVGFYGEMPPFKSVREAAAYQIAQLQQHLAEQVKSRNGDADNAFYLGGYSFGGLVAYEMAQQVVKAGGHVGGLFLLDTYPPSGQGTQIGEVELIIVYDTFFAEKLGLEPTLTKEQLTPLTSEERLLLFKQTVEAAGALPLGSSLAQIRGLINTALADYQALEYLPTDFVSLPIHLFASMDNEGLRQVGFKDVWAEYSKQELIQARIDGWSKYGKVTVHEIPGTHRNMIRMPNAKVLAEKIKACMRQDNLFLTL